MPDTPKPKVRPLAKAADSRRDRLAAELRSNLRKRKARARSLDKAQNGDHKADNIPE
jgi:hypothetical protein